MGQTWTVLWTGLWNERVCVARKAERRENSLSGTKRCILLIIVPIIMIIIGILHYILFSDPLRTLITKFSHFLPLVATQLRSPGLKFTRPTIRVIKDFSRAVLECFSLPRKMEQFEILYHFCVTFQQEMEKASNFASTTVLWYTSHKEKDYAWNKPLTHNISFMVTHPLLIKLQPFFLHNLKF